MTMIFHMRADRVRLLRKTVDLLAATVVAVAILIIIPIITPDLRQQEGARRATCHSQLRQLATAIQMYAQDNNGQLPDANWAKEISKYLGGNTKMFFCPSDAAKDNETPVSYGYNGLLLRADGSGVNSKQIKSPTKVGVLCDAYPSQPYPHGGIVSSSGLLPKDRLVTPITRHIKGTIMAYADGHAKMIPNEFNETDLSHGITRAFYRAKALGYIAKH